MTATRAEPAGQTEQAVVGELIGKHRVRREIGRGGMGAVYEAVHEGIGQRIAIKILSSEYSSDSKYVQRFFDEARAVNVVQHPGLVRIFDFGTLTSGTAYITMEFLEGESLQQRVERLREKGERFSPGEALRLARQVASTLEVVHDKGIAHRDLKPANLYIVPDQEAPGERIKILDFGIAKFFGSADTAGSEPRLLTTMGKVLGTPAYMSPEQCSGAEQVDDRIDVYSLGVILYQMLAGQLPFEAAVACLVMTKHITEEPKPLAEMHHDLPDHACVLVHEMLRKNPRERPSMAQVVTRLEEILALEQGLTSAEWRTRGSRVIKRPSSKRKLLPAVALAVVFIAGTAALWSIGRQRRVHSQKPAVHTAAVPAASTAAPLPAPAVAQAPAPASEPQAPQAKRPAPAAAVTRLRKKQAALVKGAKDPPHAAEAPAAPAPQKKELSIPVLR